MTRQDAIRQAKTEARAAGKPAFACEYWDHWWISSWPGLPWAYPDHSKIRVEPNGDTSPVKWLNITSGKVGLAILGDLNYLRSITPDARYLVEKEDDSCIYVRAYPEGRRAHR